MCRKFGSYHERSRGRKLRACRRLPSGADQLESPQWMAVHLEMPVRIVNSKDNARLKELRRALRDPERKGGGLIGIEGPHLLEEAVRAGLRFRTLFVGDGSGWAHHEGCEVLEVPRALLSRALETETPQPVAALVEPPDWKW